jgi:hypothetical protein
VPYETRPDPSQAQIVAGHYFEALDRYGSSPALTEHELERASDVARAKADAIALSIAGQTLFPDAVPGTRCRHTTPPGAEADVELSLPAEGIVVRAGKASAEVRLRRLAGFGEPVGMVPPGGSALVRVPDDAFEQQWIAGVRSSAPFLLCEPRP